MNFFLPPAKASFSWWKAVLPPTGKVDFPSVVADFLGAPKVIVGDAWVNVLAEGFKGLAKGDKRTKVVLPGYSCNEFVKAILLADLEPLFIDLDTEGKIQTTVLEQLDKTEILALLAVTTSGVVSPLSTLKDWCIANNCFMVEDAGYTFLGEDESGKKYGSFGHVAIVNMSEGKIIPCGGAAWVINESALADRWDDIGQKVAETAPVSNFRESLRLLVYQLGSSKWGYHFYQQLRMLGLKDWKSKFTSEPSRMGENYASGNLEWKDNRIVMDEEHHDQLKKILIRPWNRVRQQCALQILKDRKKLMKERKRLVELYRKLLEFPALELPQNAMPVRLPILLNVPLDSPEIIKNLASGGIKKQYPPSWPMYQLPLPNSQKYYREAFSLPLHHSVSDSDIRKIVKQVSPYRSETFA
jgi:dTDP-4-amino-4,6-dideoxygalactose transaminase